MSYEIKRYEIPIPDKLIISIYEMWQKVPEEFGIAQDIDQLRGQLSHRVRTEDRKLLYVAYVDGEIAGTSMIWISGRDPLLCEFGLPATSQEHRRKGIGQDLFSRPVDDFRAMGGEAIFLGTNQVPAERVYRRTGYSKLTGSIAQMQILNGESPEAYLVDYFRGLGPADIYEGEPNDRTSAVPLLHSPHDWQIMDCNVEMFSRRYFTHHSFAGRAGSYIDLLDNSNGTFFSARAGDRDKVVGLSTALLIGNGVCAVDAFTHRYYQDVWEDLIQASIIWGKNQGNNIFQVTLSIEDYEKIQLFKKLGFIEVGKGRTFFMDGFLLGDCPQGKHVESLIMEKGIK